MPRNSTTGEYTLLENSNYPALPGVTIASSAHNAVLEDQETALNVTPDQLQGIAWADIASASTVNIGAATSSNLRVTGTTTITAFDTIRSGITKTLRFAGALQLTYNATSMILPGAGNITTAANDVGVFQSLGSGNWVCTAYTRVPPRTITGTTGRITVTNGDGVSGNPTIDVDPAVSFREALTSLRTYYVRTDGSDSNTGLVNSAGGAFLTLQHAADVIQQTLDLNGNNVIVDIGDGTYTAGVTVDGSWVGEGFVYFIGDTVTPSNVNINTTSASCFFALNSARFGVRGVKMTTTTSGVCIGAYLNSYVNYQSVDFGACAESHVECGTNSTISPDGAYAISGSAVSHWHTGSPGIIACGGPFSVTITGTPAFSSYFAGVAQGAITCGLVTYIGSATGVRFLAHKNGVIDVNTQGLTALPGDIAGRVASGGIYKGNQATPLYVMTDTTNSGGVYSEWRAAGWDADNATPNTFDTKFLVQAGTDPKGYFYCNGDEGYSSGRTHFAGDAYVQVSSGTTDGWSFEPKAFGIVFQASANGAAVGAMRRRTSDGDILSFFRDTSSVGSISVTTTATAYNTASDARLKDKIERLTEAGEVIDNTEIWRFRWNHVEGDRMAVGVMAQDAFLVVPEAVTPGDDNPAGRPGEKGWHQWGVDQAKWMPYVIAEMQSMRRRLAALEGGARFAEMPPAYIDRAERAKEVVGSLEAIKAKLDASRKMIPDQIGELMEAGETIAEARDRLTPKLNTELSKLKNLRGLAGEDLNREAEIETLLGMLSRLGEG